MNIVRCTNGHFFDVDSYPACPHCGAAKIDPETWKDVLVCLTMTKRINEKLASDHVNKHNALFAVSFVADHLFTCPVTDLNIPDECPNID